MTSGAAVRDIIVETHIRIGVGSVALVRERYTAPIDIAGSNRDHHLQLCLLPNSGSQVACYPEHWSPHRFERLGDLFMVPATASLHARSACSIQRAVVCHLERDRVIEWLGNDLEWTEPRLLGSLDITSTEVRRLMFRIADEIRAPGFASEAMIELSAAQACIELARYFRGVDMIQPNGALPPWRSRLIEEAVAADPGGTTLSGLALLCGLSVRHLTRAFRASTNRSLGDYIAEHRLTRAQRLLAAGATVKEASFSAGFTSPTNFAAAFRRATGHTPTAFRALASQRKIH